MREIKINSARTAEDIAQDERFVRIVENAIEKSEIKGAPVALYDSTTRKAFLSYPDGRKQYEA